MKINIITILLISLFTGIQGLSESLTMSGPELTKTFAVSPGGTLTIDADRGSITVRSSKSDHVDVQIVRKISNASKSELDSILAKHLVELNHDGKDVSIRATSSVNKIGGSWWKSPGLDVRYTVSIPEQYNLQLSTAGGNIQCNDLTGNAHAKSSGGNIKLGRIHGKVSASAAGGNIQVEGAGESIEAKASGGKVDIGTVEGSATISSAGGSISVGKTGGKTSAKSSGGNVHLGQIQGDLEAQSAGGSIDINQVTGSVSAKASGGNVKIQRAEDSVQASSAGGSVEVTLVKTPKQDSKLSASGGNVRIGLARNMDLDVEARASGGSVHSELPIGAPDKTKSRLQGTLNKGGAHLLVTSAGGSIYLNEAR